MAGNANLVCSPLSDAAASPITAGLKPYVLVRGRLEALMTRALTYDLAELAMEERGRAGVWSRGSFFPLEVSGPTADPASASTTR